MNREIRNIVLLITLLIIGVSNLMAIEKPEYEVIKKYDDFELRKYQPYLIAETEVDGSIEDASNKAFNILFKYISGNNVKNEKIKMTAPVNQRNSERAGEKIAMTAPVAQTKSMESEGKYRVSFVVPSKYTMETVPIPQDSRVNIVEIPGKLMAVIRYSGRWTESNYRKHEKILLNAISDQELEMIGDPVYARYNPPFWPAFMRRNEIMIEVKEKDF